MKNNSFMKKTGAAFLCQGIGLLYEFFIMILAGRLLGAKEYGIVLYVYTILSLCMIVTQLGFENSMVSLMARRDISVEKKRWIVLFCLLVSVFLSIIVLFVLNKFQFTVISLMGTGGGNYNVLRQMSPIIILETVGTLFSSVLRGRKETIKYYIVYMHMRYGVRLAAFIVLWHLFAMKNIYSLIISYYLSDIAMVAMALFFLNDMHIFRGSKEKESLNFLFSLSIPLMLSSAITIVNSQIDLYMIGYYLNDSMLAIYSMALNIGRGSSFALVAINSIFAPMISEYYYSGMIKKLEVLYSRTTKWITCFNVIVMGVVTVCAKDILCLIGQEYVEGIKTLVIILTGEAVNAMVGSVGYLNAMTGKAGYVLIANLIAVFANAILNNQLIPVYGIAGAAIASAASMITSNLLLFMLMFRHLGIQPYTLKYLGVLIAFATAFIPTIVIHNIWNRGNVSVIVICSLVFCLIFGIVTYLLVCEEDEKMFIKSHMGGLL